MSDTTWAAQGMINRYPKNIRAFNVLSTLFRIVDILINPYYVRQVYLPGKYK